MLHSCCLVCIVQFFVALTHFPRNLLLFFTALNGSALVSGGLGLLHVCRLHLVFLRKSSSPSTVGNPPTPCSGDVLPVRGSSFPSGFVWALTLTLGAPLTPINPMPWVGTKFVVRPLLELWVECIIDSNVSVRHNCSKCSPYLCPSLWSSFCLLPNQRWRRWARAPSSRLESFSYLRLRLTDRT